MLRTGIPFRTWLEEDDQVIETALEILRGQPHNEDE